MFLSNADGDVGELLVLPQGCQGCFRGSLGNVGFLTRYHMKKVPQLPWRGISSDFSRVVAGNLVFFWSYDGDLRYLLVRPQESPVSTRVARDLSGFLSSRCRGRGPHLELMPEAQVSSPVLTGILGFLCSFNRGVKPRLVCRHASFFPLELKKQCQGSCRLDIGMVPFSPVATGLSHLPSCLELILWVTVELVQGSQVYLEWIGLSRSFAMVP